MPIKKSTVLHGATQLGMPRAKPFKKKVGDLDAGYSRAYRGIKRTIMPRMSNIPHRKTESGSDPKKLAI
jgi:hypothetical protein